MYPTTQTLDQVRSAALQSQTSKPTTLTSWTDTIRQKLATDDRWLHRAVIAIYEKQTEDEQRTETTNHTNGVGFTGMDARFGASLAKQLIQRGTLSPKQTAAARKMMMKYAGQLARIARDKASTKEVAA